MAKTIAQLRTEAQTIKNETTIGANTATRVGGFGEDIVDYLDTEIDNTFATGEAVDDVSVFDELSELDGKTDEQKHAMIPDGNVVEEIVGNVGDVAISLNHMILPGMMVSNNGTVGSTAPYVFGTNANFSLAKIPCSAGDRFRLTCAGGATYVAYTFLNVQNVILGTSGASATLVDEVITAPSGSSTLLVHNNKTLSSEFKVEKLESVDAELADFRSYLEAEPIPSAAQKNGTIRQYDGVYTSAATNQHTLFLRRFPIADPGQKYTADLRLVAGTGSYSKFAGVAYYDANDKFIRSEYNDFGSSTATEYKNVPLHVPDNAAYCWILGSDTIGSAGGILPQLYQMCGAEKTGTEILGASEKAICELTMVGDGTTLVISNPVAVEPNKTYKLYCNPSTWTMPAPTASTTGVGVWQYRNTVDAYLEYHAILQNKFSGIASGLYIRTGADTHYIRIQFRALAGTLLTFTLVEEEDIHALLSVSQPHYPIGTSGAIDYHIAKVMSPIYRTGDDSSSYIAFDEIDSAWAISWPSTYSQKGKPTQVIAMLHGNVGYVTPTVMGYASANWIAWRNEYLAAGFAVIDINGWGVSTQSDGKSTHWGCPLALATIDKAFSFLLERYNIADKLLLHGSSMGGGTAWNYAITYPHRVGGIALFAPAYTSWVALVPRTGLEDRRGFVAVSWQYADLATAESDNWSKLIGYDPVLQCDRYDADGAWIGHPSALNGYDVLSQGTNILVGKDIPCPIRIWHGTADEFVPVGLSEMMTTAYRRGGQNITLRYCPDAVHNMCTGNVDYVRAESVDFMKMYR